MSAIHMLAKTGQRSIDNACISNDTILNATSKEFIPTQCRKNAENSDHEIKKNKGWTKPAKYVPITCLHKKIESNENDNKNNNRCEGFTDDMELDAKCEEDSAKIIIKEKEIIWKNIFNKSRKKEKF